MPTVTKDLRVAYGTTVYGEIKRLDIIEEIDLITPTEIPFLSYLGFSKQAEGTPSVGVDSLSKTCIQQLHQWQNDELVPFESVISAATQGATIDITLPAGESHFFAVDDVISVRSPTSDGDIYVVSAIDTVDHHVYGARVSGSASDSAATYKVTRIGTAKGDAAATPTTYRSTSINQVSNYTQIFMDAIAVGGSLRATEVIGVADDLLRQREKKFKEIVLQLEKAAIYGRKVDASGLTPPRYLMGGMAEFVRYDATANRKDAGAAALTESMLIDVLETAWQRGGKPTTIMCNSTQKRYMNSWLSPYVRTDITQHTAGIIVGQYDSDYGILDVVLNRHMSPTDVLLFTADSIGIGPLKGNGENRSFFYEDLPRDGDRYRGQIIGEYTMEVRNNTQAHAWIYNLPST